MASTTPAASSSQHPLDMRPVGEATPRGHPENRTAELPQNPPLLPERVAQEPSIQGRVSPSFYIERDGSVSHLQDASSELPEAVVSCILQAFSKLSFPPPKDGIVTVVYPISFTLDG